MKQKHAMEASFLVEFEDFNQLENAREAIKKLDKTFAITFMDNSRDF
jgi:hypothetical protein